MGLCPYTLFKKLVPGKKKSTGVANHLYVEVQRGSQKVVEVELPAQSARWLIELIPDDVIVKIKEEGIPLEKIQAELAQMKELVPLLIFELIERHRTVKVWLE